MEILKYQLNCSILFQMPTHIQDRYVGGVGGGLLNLNIVDNAGNKNNITTFKQAEITLMVLNNVGCYPHLNLNQSLARMLSIDNEETYLNGYENAGCYMPETLGIISRFD